MSPLGSGTPIRSFGPLGSMSSIPYIRPRPRISPMMDTSFRSFLRRSIMYSPLRVTSARKAGSLILLITTVPAAIANWFPRKVPVCAPGPHLSRSLS